MLWTQLQKKKKKKKGPPVKTFFVRNGAEIVGGEKPEKNVSSKFKSNNLTHVPTFYVTLFRRYAS